MGMLLIATFWISTLVSELFLDRVAVVMIKHCIAMYGLAFLVVLQLMTSGSGFALGKGRRGRLLEEKKKRMPIIGANGVLIMIPAAIFLNAKASAGEFDAWFYAIQTVELAVGLVQLTLMGRNFRAGLSLSGRLRATAIK